MITYHTGITGRDNPSRVAGIVSADRISMMSGASQMRSIAPSMMNNDFNGKKQKIIQTCREIDDMKSGVIKTNVFQNLLSCLEVEVQQEDLAEC